MKKLLPAAAALALAACQDPVAPGSRAAAGRAAGPALGPAAAAPAPAADVVPGRYVVRFAPEVRQPLPLVAAKVRAAGGRLVAPLVGEAFRGFVADLPPAGAAALAGDGDVIAVEPDRVIRGVAMQQAAPWGLDRADQRGLPLSGSYGYDRTGEGVRVYLFDSGINLAHEEFEGRAVRGMDYATPNGPAADCHGHGSHVAGIVGGRTYGVAKGARLVAVRVLDCAMRGSVAGAINGLNWVVAQKRANPAVPMVVNMSFDVGAGSSLLDQTVTAAVRAGITVVVAAGNAGRDACQASPARIPAAITVGAVDWTDAMPAWSNRGRCVDLLAPGTSIPSAWTGSATAAVLMSGTSMAAPHVAGAAALYLSANPWATPAQVAAALTGHATAGAVRNLPAGTPDRLLYTGFLGLP